MRHIVKAISTVFQYMGFAIGMFFIYSGHIIWNFGIKRDDLSETLERHALYEYGPDGKQQGWLALFWIAFILTLGVFVYAWLFYQGHGYEFWEEKPEKL